MLHLVISVTFTQDYLTRYQFYLHVMSLFFAFLKVNYSDGFSINKKCKDKQIFCNYLSTTMFLCKLYWSV